MLTSVKMILTGGLGDPFFMGPSCRFLSAKNPPKDRFLSETFSSFWGSALAKRFPPAMKRKQADHVRVPLPP
jgi:hypothetical protein